MPFILRITVPKAEEELLNNRDNPVNIQETSSEDAVRKVLSDNDIQEQTWRLSNNGKYYTVEFQVYESSVSDSIVDQLAFHNIGKKEYTSIMIIEPTVTISNRNGNRITTESSNPMSSERFKKFVKSLKSRITIAQIYESIRQRSAFDVNYLAFLLCAAIVAVVALVTNSVASVFASMLLSPLMDPIMCVVYGLVLRENSLLRKGLRNGFVSLLICVLTGFVFGIPAHYIAQFEETDPYPTAEMRSRVRAQGLLSSLVVATFSGLSVAFANLQNSVAALIGNAISLSLLPPAVNSGLFLFLSCLAAMERDHVCIPNSNGTTFACNYKSYKNYSPLYVKRKYDLPIEFAISSGVSFIITCINIIIIIITGYIVNKIKDLAPKSFTNNITRTFYKEDLKAVTDNYKCLQKVTAKELANELANQALNNYIGLTDGTTSKDIERKTAEFNAVIDSVTSDKNLQRIATTTGSNWIDEFASASKEAAEQRRQSFTNIRHHTINTFENFISTSASSVPKEALITNYNQFSVGPATLRNYAIEDLQLSGTGHILRYNQIRDLTRLYSDDVAGEEEEGAESETTGKLGKRFKHRLLLSKHSQSLDGDYSRKFKNFLNRFPISDNFFVGKSKTSKLQDLFSRIHQKNEALNTVNEVDEFANSRRGSAVKFIDPQDISLPQSRKNSSPTNFECLTDTNQGEPIKVNPLHKSNSAHSTASMTGRFSVVKTEFINTPTNPSAPWSSKLLSQQPTKKKSDTLN